MPEVDLKISKYRNFENSDFTWAFSTMARNLQGNILTIMYYSTSAILGHVNEEFWGPTDIRNDVTELTSWRGMFHRYVRVIL